MEQGPNLKKKKIMHQSVCDPEGMFLIKSPGVRE